MLSSTRLISNIPNTVSFLAEARAGFTADLASPPSTLKEQQELLTSIQSFAFQFLKAAAHASHSHQASAQTDHGPSGEQDESDHHVVKANTDPEAKTDDLAQQGLVILWGMFTSTAQVIDADDAFQDRLVGLLVWTREFDGAYRRLHGLVVGGADAGGGGWESYGFGQSLQLAWEQLVVDLPSAVATQKSRNLAAFSAKVLAMGLCKEFIAGTAFWVFERALGGDRDRDEIVSRELVPAAVVWLKHASHALLARCCSSPAAGGLDIITNTATDPISRADAPSTDQTTAETQYGELSMSQWLRWRRRLQELSHDADADVARLAKKGFMSMIFCGRDLGVDVEGEARFAERLQGVMYRELVRSGKEVVEGDEVEIEVDWVD
ncbi:hypothetical protein HER10_EVM0009491 [Colletotrichum scovillei]|uniref:Uncharacterized protein n=1 Tax=Colletotrichum scovillei TaxID=1209932 RepID=A0A9P7RKP9_9PEZI|nr:uncharacterized protein HER10_EVM0009491 [Colletotrichum scovillei]KAF4777896.1 hypothetical protein HER10_EVM0009491 [Colletotrichum scovillei]KAG7059203.1 hypothetical protein JMJ77_0006571 [Colletotrichum scovillei]KAG7077843.1 hypothetical protein JMJ76_0015085 [Colletotrichum scovillei]KAG7084973.1 hypothetical protein JMJ78_0010403 [Colletotrichum scovillei]